MLPRDFLFIETLHHAMLRYMTFSANSSLETTLLMQKYYFMSFQLFFIDLEEAISNRVKIHTLWFFS